VLDFVSKNKTKATMGVPGKNFGYFKNIYTFHVKKAKRMGEFYANNIELNEVSCSRLKFDIRILTLLRV
jgi:hypothetical protein